MNNNYSLYKMIENILDQESSFSFTNNYSNSYSNNFTNSFINNYSNSFTNSFTNNYSNSYSYSNNFINNYSNSYSYSNNFTNNFTNSFTNSFTNNYSNRSLYKYIKKTKYKDIYNPINDICPISQTNFKYNSDIIQINACKHIFFEKNILKWFEINNTCPICRYNIITNNN